MFRSKSIAALCASFSLSAATGACASLEDSDASQANQVTNAESIATNEMEHIEVTALPAIVFGDVVYTLVTSRVGRMGFSYAIKKVLRGSSTVTSLPRFGRGSTVSEIMNILGKHTSGATPTQLRKWAEHIYASVNSDEHAGTAGNAERQSVCNQKNKERLQACDNSNIRRYYVPLGRPLVLDCPTYSIKMKSYLRNCLAAAKAADAACKNADTPTEYESCSSILASGWVTKAIKSFNQCPSVTNAFSPDYDKDDYDDLIRQYGNGSLSCN